MGFINTGDWRFLFVTVSRSLSVRFSGAELQAVSTKQQRMMFRLKILENSKMRIDVFVLLFILRLRDKAVIVDARQSKSGLI